MFLCLFLASVGIFYFLLFTRVNNYLLITTDVIANKVIDQGCREHFSKGGHTIWLGSYEHGTYLREHDKDTTSMNSWIQKKLQTGPPKRQTHYR